MDAGSTPATSTNEAHTVSLGRCTCIAQRVLIGLGDPSGLVSHLTRQSRPLQQGGTNSCNIGGEWILTKERGTSLNRQFISTSDEGCGLNRISPVKKSSGAFLCKIYGGLFAHSKIWLIFEVSNKPNDNDMNTSIYVYDRKENRKITMQSISSAQKKIRSEKGRYTICAFDTCEA